MAQGRGESASRRPGSKANKNHLLLPANLRGGRAIKGEGFLSLTASRRRRKLGHARGEPVAPANAGSPSCGVLDVVGPAWLRWALGQYVCAYSVYSPMAGSLISLCPVG